MSYFVVKAQGLDMAQVRLGRLATAAADATPAMIGVAEMMMGFILRTFESGGRRGGGSWAALTEDWLVQKQRLKLDPRIGYATHALVDSLTIPEASGQILDITPHAVRLGSDLPYAATQQKHRPFVKFSVNDRIALRDAVHNYFVAAWKAPV